MSVLDEAIDRVMAGPQRRTRLMSDKEKKVTAYHEAGHALVAHALPNTDPVHKITILPRGRALGYTMVLPNEDKYSQTRAELLDQLAYAMGGRAAEELVFHDPTTGASNDIEKATGTARAMVTQYGMCERLGAVKFGEGSGEVFMGKDMGHGRDYSEEIAAQVDAEVRALVENAHHEAWEILVEYRDVLDDMVLKLLDKETLTKDEIAEVFAPIDKRPPARAPDRQRPSSALESSAGAHARRARAHGPGRRAGARGPRPWPPQHGCAQGHVTPPAPRRLRTPLTRRRRRRARGPTSTALPPRLARRPARPAQRAAPLPPRRRLPSLPPPSPRRRSPRPPSPRRAAARRLRRRPRARPPRRRQPTTVRRARPRRRRPRCSRAGSAASGHRHRPGLLSRRVPSFDTPRVEAAVRELLAAVGEDVDREGLRETPARVARMYAEVFSGLHSELDDLALPIFDEHHDELIIVKDIPLSSFCEHHLVPWTGRAAVGYLPGRDGRITGLSKLARLVDLYAKRPSVQERLTTQVADALVARLDPRGVIVVVEAEHMCMTVRGVHKPGARTVTSAVRGVLKTSAVTRSEAMSLILGR